MMQVPAEVSRLTCHAWIAFVAAVVCALGCGRVGFDPADGAVPIDAAADSAASDGGLDAHDDTGVGDTGADSTIPDPDTGMGDGGTPCGTIVDVSAGQFSTCAIRRDGALFCWGLNVRGQVGIGPVDSLTTLPTRVPVELGFTRFGRNAFGGRCALTEGRDLYCWGSNFEGQLGVGDMADRNAPTFVTDAVLEASLGSCAIRGDTLACWGPANGAVTTPTPVPLGGVSVVDADATTCAIDGVGTMSCWGDNDSGQAGVGHTMPVATPTALAGTWSDVAIAARVACGVSTDRRLFCWGRNSYGKLGLGMATTEALTPTEVTTLAEGWTRVDGSTWSMCGLRDDGSLYCWGEGVFGNLGDGDNATRYEATRVVGTTTWRSFSVGQEHTCAIDGEGELYCWGDGGNFELGLGEEVLAVTEPTRVCVR